VNENESQPPLTPQRVSTFAAVSGCLLVAVICYFAIGAMKHYKPVASKVDPPAKNPVVEIFTINEHQGLRDFPGRAVVESRRVVSLSAEVMGRVLEISPDWKKGGRVQEGQMVARIDDADYTAQAARADATYAQAQEAYALESTQAQMSLIEWRRISKEEPSALTKREPQVQRALAMVASAKAERERAERDLTRTRILAPFAGRVRSAAIEAGSIISSVMPIGELYSDRMLELRVPIRLKDLADLDKEGTAKVRLDSSPSSEWQAKIITTDGEMDRSTHTIHVILHLQVADPQEPPPVGSFVSVALPLREAKEQHLIPREAVLDGDHVHIINAKEELEKIPVKVIRGDSARALVEGLTTGQRVCLTRLQLALPNMQVRIAPAP
jgi:RND family efflux transporter MFP subunit